jgi:adhesin transport system outer membrane protein
MGHHPMSGLRRSFRTALRASLLGSVFAAVWVFAAQATSLEDAVRISLATNPDIGVVASNREAVDEELRQARGLYLPQIDGAAGIGEEQHDAISTRRTNNDSRWLTRQEASATLIQRLFTGFETEYTVERDQARVESAANRVFENAEFLALDTVGAYYEVLRQRELVNLSDENVRIHVGIVDQIREQLAGGGGSRADLAQSESRLSRARATLAQALTDLRDAEAFYTRVVGQYPDDLTMPEFDESLMPVNLNDAIGLVNEDNPTVSIFEADVRTAEAEVGISDAPFYPQVNFEAQTAWTDNADGVDSQEWNNQFMVRLRWNLFRGGIDKAARQEALARMNEAKNRRQASLVDAQREMRNSWFALEGNNQRVEDLTSAVEFSRETRDAYREQFDVAQRTLLDVLDAENELFVSRGQLVTSQINEILARYRILALGGQLLASLDVPAPEQAVVEKKTWAEGVGLTSGE